MEVTDDHEQVCKPLYIHNVINCIHCSALNKFLSATQQKNITDLSLCDLY